MRVSFWSSLKRLSVVCVCLFIQNMQQHLSEEESSGQALRDELDTKEKELLQLHAAVKEVSYTDSYFYYLFSNYYELFSIHYELFSIRYELFSVYY